MCYFTKQAGSLAKFSLFAGSHPNSNSNSNSESHPNSTKPTGGAASPLPLNAIIPKSLSPQNSKGPHRIPPSVFESDKKT